VQQSQMRKRYKIRFKNYEENQTEYIQDGFKWKEVGEKGKAFK
jgi:hypothetical protein